MMAVPNTRSIKRQTSVFVQYEYLILFLITLQAAVIRGINLGTWSFGTDELFTLQNAQNLWHMPFAYRVLVEHPITSGFVLGTTQLIGLNEWSARLMPAIIGIFSVPVVYWLVKKMANMEIAVVTAVMLSISPWHLFWSQNARFYVLLLLLYTLGLWSFYWGIEKNDTSVIFAAMGWMVLAISERLLAVMLGPVIVAYFIALRLLPFAKPPGLNWKTIAIILVPGILFGIVFAWDFVREPSLWQSLYMDWIGRGPADVVWDFVKGVDFPIAVLALVGMVDGWQRRDRFVLLSALNVLIPLAIMMAAALVQFTHNRYLFITIISVFVLAAFGVKKLYNLFSTKVKWAAPLIVLVVVAFSMQDVVEYNVSKNGWRIDWRAGVNVVLDAADDGDLIMSNNPDVGRFYTGRDVMGLADAETAVSHINAARTPIWFIVGGSAKLDYTVHQWIIENGTKMFASPFKVDVYKYQPIDSE